MAIPLHVTTKANSGKFLLNRSLSDNSESEEILQLQGVAWWKRYAISKLPAHFSIKHIIDEAGIERFHATQKLTEHLCSTKSLVLDWRERDEDDVVFGCVTIKYRKVPVEEITDEFLKKDWAQDAIDNGIILIHSYPTPGKNNTTWRAVQVWGFGMVNGERRYVKRVALTSSQKVHPVHARLVFDYLGEI